MSDVNHVVAVSTHELMGIESNRLPDDHVGKYIELGLMYRDAGNYKTSNTYAFVNDAGLSKAQLLRWFEEYMPVDNVVAKDYELPNLAPLYSEFESSGDGDDHCFMEITSIDITDKTNKEMGPDPFSVVYQAAIELLTPQGQAISAKEDQRIVINDLKECASALMDSLKDHNQEYVKKEIADTVKKLVDYVGDDALPRGKKLVPDYQQIVDHDVDLNLLQLIGVMALEYSKSRNELIEQFGYERISKLQLALAKRGAQDLL